MKAVCIAPVLLLTVAFAAPTFAAGHTPEGDGLEITLNTDTTEHNGLRITLMSDLSYSYGQPVGFTLSVTNTGKKTVKLPFADHIAFDYQVRPDQGPKTLRYSRYQVARFVGQKELLTLASGETKSWSANWQQSAKYVTPMPPGSYHLLAKLRGTNSACHSVSVEFKVEPPAGVIVTEDDIHSYYEKNKTTMFSVPERVKIAAIITKSERKIAAADKRLKTGRGFSAVVLDLSEDELSRKSSNPGELGWVWRGQTGVPEIIIETAFKLKNSQVSSPFQVTVYDKSTDWVILKCLAHENQSLKSLSEVRDDVLGELYAEKARHPGEK